MIGESRVQTGITEVPKKSSSPDPLTQCPLGVTSLPLCTLRRPSRFEKNSLVTCGSKGWPGTIEASHRHRSGDSISAHLDCIRRLSAGSNSGTGRENPTLLAGDRRQDALPSASAKLSRTAVRLQRPISGGFSLKPLDEQKDAIGFRQ